MLNWNTLVQFANRGTPPNIPKVQKSLDEWRNLLTPEQFRVAWQKGTEPAFSSDMCHLFEPGVYACACCGTPLFDAQVKFQSGTGWPSFTQPISPYAVAYHQDHSHGMYRIETTCNTCDAHLGHVFPDGPEPSGLRYCINAMVLHKIAPILQTATFGGGCFWCTEALFKEVLGVKSVISGYSGGHIRNPCYREVCNGTTGHAEVIQVTFDPTSVSYADLIQLHLASHDPTTLNQQGADRGPQYRSVIFVANEEQEKTAQQILVDMQPLFDHPIVTEIQTFQNFYPAEDDHQNYYALNTTERYCKLVIEPKLRKFRDLISKK